MPCWCFILFSDWLHRLIRVLLSVFMALWSLWLLAGINSFLGRPWPWPSFVWQVKFLDFSWNFRRLVSERRKCFSLGAQCVCLSSSLCLWLAVDNVGKHSDTRPRLREIPRCVQMVSWGTHLLSQGHGILRISNLVFLSNLVVVGPRATTLYSLVWRTDCLLS